MTRMQTMVALMVAVAGSALGQAESPRTVAEELLAADRAFAAAAADQNVIDGLTAMFRDDVTMTHPGGFATSREEARDVLAANPSNGTSRTDWSPLGGGISADGRHGFTFGAMSLRGEDGGIRRAKYLAYWIREDGQWRVAAYKRAPAVEGPLPAPMEPALPDRLEPAATDAGVIEGHRASLVAAEQAFSDEAQEVGLGPAFAMHGHANAVNMGPPDQPAFIVGADAIGAGIGAGSEGPSPVSWSAERAIVASSGDLGVTFGYIRSNQDGEAPALPFFTIWWRPSTDQPWRYIAE